jgi:hypothetical protein
VDPYQALRTLYSLNRARLVADFKPDQGGNFNPDPTVGAVLFKPKSPDFVDRAIARKILIPATGKKLTYNCWLQPKPAPMVYYIPGLGSYRLDQSVLAYADMMYRHGYSVVVFSNPFQKDFMAHASGGLRRCGQRPPTDPGRPAKMAGRQNNRQLFDRRLAWRLFHLDDRRAGGGG